MVDKLSVNRINQFLECPKRYWYYSHSDIQLPEREDPDFFKVGNAVHDSIENTLIKHPDLVSDVEGLLSQFRTEEIDLAYDYGKSNSSQVQDCLEMAAKYIAKYVDEIKHVEDSWSMEYRGIEFRGRADLVADITVEDETLKNVVIDWKTGRVKDESGERLQGGTYLEMYNDKHGSYPEAIEFVYLNEDTKSTHRRIQDGKVQWNDHKNKYWEEIQQYVHKIIKAYQAGNFPAKPESANCYFCNFKFACSDYVGSENLKPHHIEFPL